MKEKQNYTNKVFHLICIPFEEKKRLSFISPYPRVCWLGITKSFDS